MVRIAFLSLFCFAGFAADAQQVLGGVNRNVADIDIRGPLLGSISETSVELWDIRSRQLIKSVSYSGNDILTAVTFGLDSITLITGSRSGEIASWNMATGDKSVQLPSGNQGTVTSLASSPDSHLIAAGFSNRKLSVFQKSDWKEIYSSNDFSSDVTCVAFSTDGLTLAAGSGDGKVTVHHLDTKGTKLLGEYKKWIRALAFSSDSTRLAIGTDSGMITMRRKSGNWVDAILLSEKRLGGDWVTSIAYSPGDPTCWSIGTLSGTVAISTGQGQYKSKMKAVVNRVKLLPSFDKYTYVAVATRGKGLIILSAAKMNYDR